MAASAWAPAYRYGLNDGGGATSAHTEMNAVPTPSQGGAAGGAPWSPGNPLFWFTGLAAVTVGLMAFSTSGRVGKAKIDLKVGT